LLFVLIVVKFLEFVKPFCAVLPEIQKPERKVSHLTVVISVNQLLIMMNTCG